MIARAVHVRASVLWAGFVIIVAAAIVGTPRGGPNSCSAHPPIDGSRGARIVGPAAAVSLVSGLYLFSALHTRTHTITEAVLSLGALTAVLSFFVGAIGSGPAERRLARLDQARAAGAFTEADAQIASKLDKRVVITARLTAVLLLISTLHGNARYV